MPKLLLFLGCFLLIISVLILNVPQLAQFDWAAVQWMHQHRLNSLNNLAAGLSAAGGMPFVLFLAMLWCLRLAWYKKYSDIVFISIGLVGSICIAWVLKYFVSRPRPPEMYFLVKTYGDSFPSGHSLYAAALGCLAMYISRQHPRHKLICLIASLWILLMGISRVYAGVHFPSDVFSGWSISFIWITLLYLLYAKFSSAKTN